MFDYSDISDNTSDTLDVILNSIEFSINKIADDNLGNLIFRVPHIHLTHDSTGPVPIVFCQVDETCGFEWYHYLLAQYYREIESLNVKLKLDRQNYDPGGKRLIHIPLLPNHMRSFANYVAMILNCVQDSPLVVEITTIQSTRYFYHHHTDPITKREIIKVYDTLRALTAHLIEMGIDTKFEDILIIMRAFKKVSSHECETRLPIRDAIQFLGEILILSMDDSIE